MRLVFVIVSSILLGGIILGALMMFIRRSDTSKGTTAFSKNEEIERAEAFIFSQGYTDKPSTISPENLVREGIESGSDEREILSYRSGTLLPTAVGARLGDDGTWTVGFQYRQPENPAIGRAVIVPADGSPIHIAHQDLILSSLDAK